jgi:hypothetical protein
VHAQIVFIDDRLWPHVCHDVRRADSLTGALDEQKQDFECAMTERDTLSVSRKRALFGA